MPLDRYGVLKGVVTGHLRDADDDHYQVLVRAGTTLHRIAVNVKSSAPKAPSTLLFLAKNAVPAAFAKQLQALPEGFTRLPSKPGGLAVDYVRGGWLDPRSMKKVPPDQSGEDNDLKDKMEAAAVKAMQQEGSVIYAFGQKWGPEAGKPDQYFRFVPGNGIHDIHMNQGNSGKYKRDNGVYQDGCIAIAYPQDKWVQFFFAFQSQTFRTDDRGNPAGGAVLEGAVATKGVKRAARKTTAIASRKRAARKTTAKTSRKGATRKSTAKTSRKGATRT